MERTKVLVVDDDEFFRRFCADTLTRAGHEVLTAGGGDDVLTLCEVEPVALVLVDVYMPNKSGIEILEEIKSLFPSIDVVVTTGYASVETAVQALKKGASDYLRKPFSPEELSAAVGSVLAQRRLYQDNEELKKQLRLYELSRSFAAIEEPQRVASIGLEALREITGARAGACVVPSEDGEGLTISAAKHFSAKEEKALKGIVALMTRLPKSASMVKELYGDEFIEVFGSLSPGRIDKALLVVLDSMDSPNAFFALFRDAEAQPFSERAFKGAEFLGAQIAIAFKTAARFQEAKGMAYVDSLTDLYNARYLPVILEKRINEAKDGGKPLSLLFIDMDNFRDINTKHGHLAGSKTLIEAAWILESNVRGGDTVIRYGGDEFTIVLPNADTDSAKEIAERIRKAIQSHVFLGRENKSVRVTACIGVATYPNDAKTAELLINLADQAMYRGKSANRNVVYTAASGRVNEN